MCGILAIMGLPDPNGGPKLRHTALQLSKRLRHRGPDWSGIYAKGNAVIAHERLAIIDVVSGAQPLYTLDESVVLAVNGEIYNHIQLRDTLSPETVYDSQSDCVVILHKFAQSGAFDNASSICNELRGMFAFVALEPETKRFIAARDPIGIVPLYVGWGQDGSVWFASEMKALADHCKTFKQFPPGHIYDSAADYGKKFMRYYNPLWNDLEFLPTTPLELTTLRERLTAAVESHMMADVPFGVLLSGGLDSSLISSIACRLLKERHGPLDESATSVWMRKMPSYSVGLEGSPGLKAAQHVATFLNTCHHAFTFTVQDGLDALSDVIYHLETYDVTTVRASTPMYLMARLIKATGVKMVLSGEGADEVFGGYLYFHKAPSAKEFQAECARKVQNLHMFDCLRANKAMASFGVEVRVPFLDTNFITYAMDIDPNHKMCVDELSGLRRIEKHILRAAFDTPENPYLPREVLWRQKEQFSDGVGYSWIDGLKDCAESHISDAQMETAEFRFPDNTPTSKEAYMYRQIFEGHFPQPAALQTVPGGPSIACSTAAAIEWDSQWKNMADPSGRAVLGFHNQAYGLQS